MKKELSEGRSWVEDLENEIKVDKMMLSKKQAKEELSNMSEEEIISSWRFYRNYYVRSTS